MRIMHIGNLKSGIDIYVRNTMAMADRQFEFVIVSGADDAGTPYVRDGIVLKNYRISMYRALNPVRDIKAVVQTVRIIRKERPDAIHCHSAKGGMIGRIAAFVTGTPAFYTPHAFSFLSAETRMKRALFLTFERMTRFNSRLLACSESERQIGIERVWYKPDHSFAWPNAIHAIDDAVIIPPKGLAPDERFIISIGRPSYQKNPLLMVEIMRRVHERFPDVHFYLLGVGFYSPMLGEMNELIDKYGLGDVMKILPWLSHGEALGYLRRSQMYLTTSLYEGLPIAVLEALAMGKAVVASDVMGNRDCVRDGSNGWLLPMDAGLFADRICHLLDDDGLREMMEANSLRLFNSSFLIDNRIGDLENIYINALNC